MSEIEELTKVVDETLSAISDAEFVARSLAQVHPSDEAMIEMRGHIQHDREVA